MYNPRQMSSAVKSGVVGVAGLVAIVAGCAEPKLPIVLTPDMQNTITKVSQQDQREVIYNLSGDWRYFSRSSAGFRG